MIENARFLNADLEVDSREARGPCQQPNDVVADPNTSPAEKRALLASWASDARAVPGVPAIPPRQGGGGAFVFLEPVAA